MRQNSEKIGAFAEVAVLPKSQRNVQRTSTFDELTVRDVEAQDTFIPTLTIRNPPQRQKKYFPIFMICISLLEVNMKRKIDFQFVIVDFLRSS